MFEAGKKKGLNSPLGCIFGDRHSLATKGSAKVRQKTMEGPE